eukprot:205457_1
MSNIDSQDIIDRILELQSNEDEIKLIVRIMDNIINNLSVIKYRSVSVNILKSKLNHHQEWFKLLQDAGFYRSNNAKQLVFDINQLDRLKLVKNILQQNAIIKSIITTDTKAKGISLILKIMNNILNNKTEIKYQSLKVNSILSKLNNNHIWIEALLCSGFILSENGKRLLFGIQKIDQLKYMRNALSSIKSSLSVNIDHNNKSDIHCICGSILSMTKPSTVVYYDSVSVVCDICEQTIGNMDMFWHCNQGKTQHHTNGYDVCLICINNQTQIGTITNSHLCDIKNCPSLVTFHTVITEEYDKILVNDTIDISHIIDHYIHLQDWHDSDEEFEFILKLLGECKISKCIKFQRNYRNRSEFKQHNEMKLDTHQMAIIQILDKMHCYFCHTIDIGNRISINDINSIVAVCNTDDIEQYLVNQKLLMIKQILGSKLKHLNSTIKQRIVRINKYNQLKLNTESKIDIEEKKEMYEEGMLFEYKDEHPHQYTVWDIPRPVNPTHCSLKEEIINNSIYPLLMENFTVEYKKAQMHFNSKYRKTLYSHMGVEYILALLFYCNYTEFQFEFSKTYREDKGKQHHNLYWMGRYLKEAIHVYGIPKDYSYISSFYHGLGKKLSFDNIYEVLIWCPLSTTESFEVAANFTNDNNGIIVQFDNCGKYYNQYFSCAWLSDFAGEKEYLFVQNRFEMAIQNITSASGCDYTIVAKALEFTHRVIRGFIIWNDDFKISDESDEECYDLSYKPEKEFYQGNGRKNRRVIISKDESETIKALSAAIIENKLSTKIQHCRQFKSLQKYAKIMCNTYFNEYTYLHISMGVKAVNQRISNVDSELLKLLYHSNQSVNIVNMQHIYPRIKSINILHVKITAHLLKCLMDEWQTIINSSMKTVRILPFYVHKSNQWPRGMPPLIDEHYKICRDGNTGAFITANLWNGWINIEISDKIDFIVSLIQWMGLLYCKDIYNEIYSLMTTLVELELSKHTSHNMDVNDAKEFHQCCLNVKFMRINFLVVKLNPMIEVFSMFFENEFEWINLRRINKLFPNLENLQIVCFQINFGMIFTIIKHLMEIHTKLNDIIITSIKLMDEDWSELKSQFKFQFDACGFKFKHECHDDGGETVNIDKKE